MFLLLFVSNTILAKEKFENDSYLKISQTKIYPNSLKAFIYQVLEDNPEVQAAKVNIDAQHARLEAAEQPLYNPALVADTEQKRQRSFKDPELALEGIKPYEDTYTIGINQTFDLANKRLVRSKVADKNLHVAECQLAALRQQLATEVLNALIRYQTTQLVVNLAKERTALLKKFVNLTEKREATGDVPSVETDLAKLALSEAIVQQADAEINLNQILQDLRALTGLNQIVWPDLPSLPVLPFVNENINELLNSLPALQVLNEQYLGAMMRVQLTKRERFPDPTFGIQGGRENTNEGTKRVWLATFSVPLFIRNSYRAEVEAASFDAMEADKKRLNLLRQVSANIVSSAERYQMLYQTFQETQQISKKPLNDGVNLIERLWQAGELSTTDYLVQFKQRLDSQIAVAELRTRTWQAWGDWLKASGTIENWLQGK
ncbi:MAG: TolC family protein [Gammaproteobacteria bacterium]|nr:TolC family protein [Gammaproteobacteria bacterium]